MVEQATKIESLQQESKYPGCRCWECPLKDRQFVPPELPKQYDALFLGQAPANTEIRTGKLLTGPSGKSFDSALEENGIDRPNVGVDNTVLCYWYSPDGGRPPKEAIEACKGHINFEKPKVIIPMGNDAMGVTIDKWDGILSVSGTSIQRGEKVVVPLAHPAFYIRSDPNNFRNFKDGISVVKDIIDNRTYFHVGQKCRIIKNKQEALELFDWLYNNPPEKLSVDLETDYPDIGGAVITSLGLAWTEEEGVIIPWSSAYLEKHNSDLEPVLEDWDVFNAAKKVLESHPGVEAYNGPFDVGLLHREGIKVVLKNDNLLKHYALDERVGVQSLKTTGTLMLGIPNWEKDLKVFLKRKDTPYTEIPPHVLFLYQAKDCTINLAVGNKLDRVMDLPENSGPKHLYHNLIMPECRMFIETIPLGAPMDLEKIREALRTMPAKHRELLKELQDMSGVPLYNPNSHLDNRKAIFQVHGLPKIKGDSTDKDVLEAHEGHPFIDLLSEYRRYQKVINTYLVNLALAYRDGYGYPDLKLFGTVTGRLSANKLNPLVFPRESRGDLYAVAKQIFIADKDSFLLQADYSGMELRILAVLSQDPYMLEVLADPESDWHATMAEEMYGEEFRQASPDRRKEMRVIAKMLVFGLNYGRTVPSIALQMGCSDKDTCSFCMKGLRCRKAIAQATILVNKYFAPIPRVKQYREELLKQAKTFGYLETPNGRRRRFDMITDLNWHALEKQIYNFPMQATGNECNLESMRVVWENHGDVARPLWPIHDAGLYNIKRSITPERLDAILTAIQVTPSKVLNTPLPFYIDVEVGDRWGALKKVKWNGPGTTSSNKQLCELLS